MALLTMLLPVTGSDHDDACTLSTPAAQSVNPGVSVPSKTSIALNILFDF
jgi:hypothetical protein